MPKGFELGSGGGRDGLDFVVRRGARRERWRPHRDRRSDDVRAAKAGPPLRGRPGKAAEGVECLGRAAWPGLRLSPTQPPSLADPGYSQCRRRALMRVDLFDFDLPPDRIALRPAVPRDSARLLEVAG